MKARAGSDRGSESHEQAAISGGRSKGRAGGRRRLWTVVGTLIAIALVLLASGLSWLEGLAKLLLVALGLALVLWLGAAVFRRLLWRVGRRLAFTYLLVGVLPIVLIAIQTSVGLYLLSGSFLGHLFRTQLELVSTELVTRVATTASLDDGLGRPLSGSSHAALGNGFGAPAEAETIRVVHYRAGRRVGVASHIDAHAPADWPQWLADRTAERARGESSEAAPFLVSSSDGSVTLAAAIGDREQGVLGYVEPPLSRLLSQRSRFWIEIGSGRDDETSGSTVSIGNNEWLLQPLRRSAIPEPARAFHRELGSEPWFFVRGIEATGPVLDLETSEAFAQDLPITLVASPLLVARSLFSGSAEIDTQAWIAFLVPAFLLFDLYAVATLMAVFLVIGLSRAVNRLSLATTAVQNGDFSARIPVRRRDQIGALQSSFNQMTSSLESLIEEASQKELLEKELQIATEVQESLLPGSVPVSAALDVATFFQPTAAIGGDYFDLIRMQGRPDCIAVINADVSGHGIGAGLRMAMLKAAFEILVAEGKDATGILDALDRLVRAQREPGVFVTATLALIDLERGAVEITNAGHPPTYLLRDGLVEEIALPGNPLGVLGHRYGRKTLDLAAGDILIWLSDGLIEATDELGDAFGYERVVESLAGEATSAHAVRNRLIEAVRTHSPKEITDDDQTMVVVRYLGRPDFEVKESLQAPSSPRNE